MPSAKASLPGSECTHSDCNQRSISGQCVNKGSPCDSPQGSDVKVLDIRKTHISMQAISAHKQSGSTLLTDPKVEESKETPCDAKQHKSNPKQSKRVAIKRLLKHHNASTLRSGMHDVPTLGLMIEAYSTEIDNARQYTSCLHEKRTKAEQEHSEFVHQHSVRSAVYEAITANLQTSLKWHNFQVAMLQRTKLISRVSNDDSVADQT